MKMFGVMTGSYRYKVFFLLLALCASVLLCAQQNYKIDYAGEGTPNFEIRYYPAEILRVGYTEHNSVAYANCFVINNLESDTVKNLQIFYARGEQSVYDTPFDGTPYLCIDSSYYDLGHKYRTMLWNNNKSGKYPGWFFYPNLKAGLPVGVYEDTLVVSGNFRNNAITFRLYLQQMVANFTEVYIYRGESYPFEGLTLTESGRYRVGTEVLDLHVIEPCEVHIEASQTFVTQASDVQLNTDRAGDYYEWTGYGLDAPTARNPIATIDTDGDKEYKIELTAFTETGPNMASNGDFEEGNTGFKSDYTYLAPACFGHNKFNPPISPGKYSVVAFPKQVNTPWTGCRYDGYMMVVDGSGKPQTVYATTVSVEPHTYYAFSAEVASVSNVQNPKYQPHIQFFINGETFTDVYEPTTKECDWHKFHQIWYSGELSGDIDISLLNTQTASGGNDMALDNVSFRKLCVAHDELTIKANFSAAPDCEVHIQASQTELCHTDEVQLSTDIEADYYLWGGYGINDPTIREPVATLDQEGDYTYDVTIKSYTEYGDNLITNGDFEAGNTGFTSDYTWMEPNEVNPGDANRHISPGKYSIVDYPLNVNWPWANCTYDGKMMVVDGKNDTKNNDVFRTEVDVLPNTWYAFSCEVSTISHAPSISSVASLQFYINGITFSEIHHPDTAMMGRGGGNYRTCRWKKIYQLWYSDDNTHIVISLQDHNGSGGGNDFAVDNLRFLPVCEAADTIHIHVNTTAKDTVFVPVSACEQYTWHGETYTESGRHEWKTQNKAGCDSVELLVLTVIPPQYSSIEDTACNSYTWHDKIYTESGDYTYEGKTEEGCTIKEELHLTIAEPKYVALTDTACDSYTWHGETYTESDVYTYRTQTVLGCDSVETLTLTIAKSYLFPETETVCDSYTWQGETYTASGDYRKDYQSVYGCDSVYTLQLTVNQSGTGEEEMVEYKEYPWKGQNYTASGDYRFDTITTHGCDSVITLHLTIVDTPFVAGLLPVADLCADDEHVAVEYTLTDVILAPQQVNVTFSNEKFETVQTDDISGTVLIALPDSIRPDYYNGLLRINYKSYVQEMPFTFLVRYPSTVIGQKWNNVLALKNSRYNGGYLWDAYRWYADNMELMGEIQSFIYCGEGKILLMGHPYHASLRRVGEDYFIPTCPIIPVPHEDVQPIPTLFQPGQRYAIRRDGQDIEITLYDALGRVLESGTEITMPTVPGVYLLETDEGIQKIIIR